MTTALLLAVATVLFAPESQAQFGRRLERAAQRGVERALERKAEQKAAEAVEEAFEGPRQAPAERETAENGATRDATSGGESSGDDAGESSGDRAGAPSGATADAPPEAVFRLDSKFDFEPGAEVLYYDDFARASIGDFPTGYNTMGSAEVVTTSTSPGKWLRMSEATGGIHLLDVTELPGDFTLEFDLIHDLPASGYRYSAGLGVLMVDAGPEDRLNERMRVGDATTAFWVGRSISRGFHSDMTKWTSTTDYTRGTSTSLDEHFSDATRGKPQHIAIWRQGRRMRMYVNQQKVYDIPLAWPDAEPIAGLRLLANMSVDTDNYLVSNLRVAEGAPDTRSKLVTEGELTTYGITFASGSSEVQPASAGTLKAIAAVLADNPGMRLRITGHTDADGSDASNQTLSEQRAIAVKRALSEHYRIDAGRLETAGLGESAPLSTEDTPGARARNRRVVLAVLR